MVLRLGTTDFHFSEWVVSVAELVVDVGGCFGWQAADVRLDNFVK